MMLLGTLVHEGLEPQDIRNLKLLVLKHHPHELVEKLNQPIRRYLDSRPWMWRRWSWDRSHRLFVFL